MAQSACLIRDNVLCQAFLAAGAETEAVAHNHADFRIILQMEIPKREQNRRNPASSLSRPP